MNQLPRRDPAAAHDPALPELDRETRRAAARILLGVVAGALLLLSVYLEASDPHLTYSSDVVAESEDIEVVCDWDEADLAPLLDDGRLFRTNYEILRGEDRIEQVENEAAEVVGEQDRPSFTIQRGINADCARADAERLRWIVWLLAGAAGCTTAAVAVRGPRH